MAGAKEAAAARYKELEADFDLVRSDLWPSLRAPYVQAISDASAEGLEAQFLRAGFLGETACRRLAAEVTKILGSAPPGEVLTRALAAVFPEPAFPACWERAFLDLPEVARIARASEAVAAAEAALKQPSVPSPPPAEPDSADHPPGMVLVPGGRVELGPWTGWVSDLKSNKALRENIQGFFIDVHEVTNASYLAFLSSVAKSSPLWSELPVGFTRDADGKLAIPEKSENLPVRGVSLEMAEAFAQSVGKRLPTEDEWEKAARGEDSRPYPWGPDFKDGAANIRETGLGTSVPVGSFPDDRSPYGVFDLAGNVPEITASLDGRRPVRGKLKATDSVILRGGSFEDGKDSAVTTYRWVLPALSRSEIAGFRCVLSERAFKRPAK
ncbi:MAG: formylglycine-generating enzyme family protein [Planctomycetes bacterium]|nr:formylglycine-generating enzyme family protein [Planctomycetota bacterium]